MALKTYDVTNILPITTERLTPETFAKFGDIISANHQIKGNKSSSANYGTAIKIHKVSRITNNFEDSYSETQATANFNIFRCSPPTDLIEENQDGKHVYKSKILERHPFSSQTFIPMGCDKDKDAYVVICAESDLSSSDCLPNINTVKAFICRGDQAVTYAAGEFCVFSFLFHMKQFL